MESSKTKTKSNKKAVASTINSLRVLAFMLSQSIEPSRPVWNDDSIHKESQASHGLKKTIVVL